MLTMADYLRDRYESTAHPGLLAILMCHLLVPMMGAHSDSAGVIFTTYTGAPRGRHRRDGCHGHPLLHGGRHPLGHGHRPSSGRADGGHVVTTFFVSLKLGGGLETINAKLASVDPNYLKFPGHNNSYPGRTMRP